MVLLTARTIDMDEAMPQTVPSAGFTPPCDYSNFAENFDLSLLPDCDPVSPSTLFYSQIDQNNIKGQPRIYTTFYPCSPEQQLADNDLTPDFQTLLVPEENKSKYSAVSNIYLEVPNSHIYPPNSPASSLSPYSPHSQGLLSPNDQLNNYRQSLEGNFYPSSPEQSLYTSPSPSSVYSKSPCDDFLNSQFNIKKEQYSSNNSPLPSFSPFRIKEENFLSPCGFSSPTSPAASYSSLSSSDQINYHHTEKTDVLDLLENTVLDKQIKQENGSTVDFSKILQFNQDTLRELLQQDLKKSESQIVPEKPKDHQLLREVLRDTSYQKKYNIRPFDLGFISGDTTDIKMEEPDKAGDLIDGCDEQIARENIEPVLNLAIEQMRKEVDSTCTSLGISPDPSKWNPANVLSWVRWTSRQFNLPEPQAEQWDLTGATLLTLSEEDFSNRASESGMFLHAQLEIWKAYSEEDLGMQWLPVENTSSNASSGDFSEDDEEETSSQPDPVKPTSSRSGSSHIHLWQFLKELLASPQTHGSCIRWLDRSKGIFKIEDSVKVARLWGKRKNRPAMNYDKLSRSIRQYYKKGIMKKTERSQRLVYQFCHPYNL